MNYIRAIVFGVVEGVSEWLPISSTAHMKMLNRFLPLEVSSNFYDLFEVVIQLGAILALLLVFFRKIWPFGKTNNPIADKGILKYCKFDKFILWIKIAIACFPVIIYKLLLDDKVNFVNSNNEMLIIAISLILVGIIFILVEIKVKDEKVKVNSTKQITYLDALIIGICQLIAAIFPGISRSGSTIITAMLLGISKISATEFTFELAIPVMFGASLMEVIEYEGVILTSDILTLLIGCFSAFVVSIFMIKFILNYLKNHNFNAFAIYRIVLGIIILIVIV